MRYDIIAELIEKFQLELDELSLKQLKDLLSSAETSGLLNSGFINNELSEFNDDEEEDEDNEDEENYDFEELEEDKEYDYDE